MRPRVRLYGLGLAISFAFLLASASASPAAGPISGRLSQPGYTVIALAASGEARTVLARDGGFTLVPPAETVTLHLRAPNGTYAGPVVVAEGISVKRARAEVRRARRKVRQAKQKMSRAQTRLRKATGRRARQNAREGLRKAFRQLRKASQRVKTAKRLLRQARGVKGARAEVRRAQRNVKQAKRKVRRARTGLRKASGTRADNSARERLRKAKRQLRKARQRLKTAKRLLRQALKQQAERLNRAIVGVRSGARLGQVIVHPGYAKTLEAGAQEQVDGSRSAQARGGVPIGAGNFGRVRSGRSDGRAIGDLDRDGVPDRLDIDDDGDLILDNLDRSNSARASQVNAEIGLIAVLNRPLYPPPNANAPGSTEPEIEAGLQTSGALIMRILPGGPVELDCGAPVPVGLRYCAPGGTGSLQPSGSSPRLEFPECCDGDGDGFGTLTRSPFGSGNQFVLDHGAPSTEIKSGQVLIEHVATGGDEGQCPPPPGPPSTSCASFPTALQYVLATVPGLKSYSDTASPTPNSATVYPVGGPTPGPGGPGTMGNGFPVRGSGPSGDGDVVLTLTFWRPQRRPIPPDPETGLGGDACAKDNPPCKWIDIGGFTYVAAPGMLSKSQWPNPPSFCPQNAYTSADLTPITIGPGLGGGLTDAGTSDQPADPSNTVTYTLNVSHCLASQGLTWPGDEELSLVFAAQAPGQPDNGTLVGVTFRRQ